MPTRTFLSCAKARPNTQSCSSQRLLIRHQTNAGGGRLALQIVQPTSGSALSFPPGPLCTASGTRTRRDQPAPNCMGPARKWMRSNIRKIAPESKGTCSAQAKRGKPRCDFTVLAFRDARKSPKPQRRWSPLRRLQGFPASAYRDGGRAVPQRIRRVRGELWAQSVRGRALCAP